MEAVGVSKLRENMMAFLKMVERGKTITITSRGHEIAELSTQLFKNTNKDPADRIIDENQKLNRLFP